MIYFTSDPHYFHANVIRYWKRPYTKHVDALSEDVRNTLNSPELAEAIKNDVLDMNEDMVARYNAVVKPKDTVYILGDFSLAFRPVELYLPRLNGHKHLITGNHDFCSSLHKKGRKNQEHWIEQYIKCGFESVKESMYLDVDGKQVLLHHMPYQSQGQDHHDQKYHASRPEDKGLFLLHGHIHEKWLQRGRMINVGVDVWDFTPVSLDQVIELMRNHKE